MAFIIWLISDILMSKIQLTMAREPFFTIVFLPRQQAA